MVGKTKNIPFEIGAGNTDYKAEVIASELIRNGIQEEEISYNSKSSFKRKFERDVQTIQLDVNAGNGGSKINIHVNREGLYDMLPEGLFHFDDVKTKERAKKKDTTVSKLKKQQEVEARKFFQPIENEFYQLLTILQLKESENLSYFSSKPNKTLFYQLYGYLPDFNDNQIAKLLYFLPLSFKLKGNIKMIGYILENLLNISVELKLTKQFEMHNFPDRISLDTMQLGVNSVVGSGVKLITYTILINLYDLKQEDTSSYFENGVNFKIIEKIMTFFLPVNYSYKVVHFFNESSKFACLENEENKSFMGYNSFI